jgi:hypothetical protein
VAFKPTAVGDRQANLSFADDAANTTDQTVPLVASLPGATAPTATAPVQSLAAGSSLTLGAPIANSTIPVDIRWTGTGTRSELQMTSGTSTTSLSTTWTNVTLSTPSATSTTVNLAMGNSTGTPVGKAYQFRVRSCTSTTTCSAWTNGPKFTLQPADETAIPAAAWKGTWTSAALTGAYGGSVRWTAGSANVTLAQTTFTVSGNAAWVSALGPDRGLAQVQVDGGTPQVVDLYSPTVTPARMVWARDALAVGNHTVTVTVLRKKSTLNPAACNTGIKCARVDVDAGVIIK